MTITEFLEARIAEDEHLARAAIEPDNMHPWGDVSLPPSPVDQWGDDVRGYLGGPWGEHCAQQNPTRSLAECAAKRAIIDEHEVIHKIYLKDYCSTCADWENSEVGEGPPGIEWPCPTLTTMAAVYADHPDYQQEWAA
jgi:hypothetical protein